MEDEEDLAQLTTVYLDREGIQCQIASSAEAALEILGSQRFDMAILDINLPGMDGFEFLQELRKTNPIPVMIVSARETEEDVITGLSAGADEYVSKPVSPRLLTARVRALLRRSKMRTPAESPHKTVSFGDLTLDFDSCLLVRDTQRIPLSAREFDVLAFLVENRGKAFAPQEIYQRVWGQKYGDPTIVAVYIQRLRKKIENDPAEPRFLETSKGKGYRFTP